MNEIYVVWNVLFKPEVLQAEPGCTGDMSTGTLFDDEEEAYEAAFSLVAKDGCERVMVICLRPWDAPKLLYVLGEFSGKECLDWYSTKGKIERSLSAAVEWVLGKFEVVKKEEVVT